MKILILLTTSILILSCNNKEKEKENSEVDVLTNSIEDNTRKAKEMSNPLFSIDSVKNDYKFKSNSLEKNQLDSNLNDKGSTE